MEQQNTLQTNLIDLASLRLDQNYQDQIGVTKRQVTIQVAKPHSQSFVRTHTNPEYWYQTGILSLKDENEHYLVHPSLWGTLPDELKPTILITSITRTGSLFLWPIRLPDSQGKHNVWHRSALEAATLAKEKWIKIAANRSLGAYDVFEAGGRLAEPVWPELSFAEILNTAFKNFFITTADHPVLQKLQGVL